MTIPWSNVWLKEVLSRDHFSQLVNEAREKTIIAETSELMKEYWVVDEMCVSGRKNSYWLADDESGSGVTRTPVSNLLTLLYWREGLGRPLTRKERVFFYKENIVPLWKAVYGSELGRRMRDLEGVFLSREEFLDVIYLLDKLLEKDEFDVGIGLIKKGVVLRRPVRMRREMGTGLASANRFVDKSG